MDIAMVLNYAEFFLEVGLWRWDHNLMGQIDGHFMGNYVSYDVGQMCRLVKLIGHNFMQSGELLSLIEDSLKMHLNHLVKNGKGTEESITGENLHHLVEGLSALGDGSRKRMFSLLKTMVILAHREGRHLLSDDPKLLATFMSLLCDM